MDLNNNLLIGGQYFIVCLFLFSGCIRNTDELICKHIESNLVKKNCDTIFFSMNNALQVDYEIGYLFGEETNSKEISKIIGISYCNDKFIPDSKYRIILLKNGEVVYENDFYQRQIEFDLKEEQDSAGIHISYNKFTSHKFKAIKKRADLSGDVFYKLMPLYE